ACRLQLAYMKQESLVIADQHAAVNTLPGRVHTARHTTRAGNTRSQCANPHGAQLPKVGPMIGVKSSPGSRIGRCGWITSFLRNLEWTLSTQYGMLSFDNTHLIVVCSVLREQS